MPKQVESDHISERELAEAYHEGWAAYPMRKVTSNPYKGKHIILEQSWEQGWQHHLDEPTECTEIGF